MTAITAPPAPPSRTPFEAMHANGKLDSDPRVNDILHSAGCRYLSDFRQGGDGFEATPRQLAYRASYRLARASMGDKYGRIVDSVVLHGVLTASLRGLTEYKSRQYSSVAVKERLSAGLMLLEKHYNSVSRPHL